MVKIGVAELVSQQNFVFFVVDASI